jgi:hypothetical protein
MSKNNTPLTDKTIVYGISSSDNHELYGFAVSTKYLKTVGHYLELPDTSIGRLIIRINFEKNNRLLHYAYTRDSRSIGSYFFESPTDSIKYTIGWAKYLVKDKRLYKKLLDLYL